MVFDKKGKAEEAKNALDQEIIFKACIKRNKVVGHYIGKNILNLNDKDLAVFIDRTIDADFEEKGDDDVIRFFAKEITSKNKSFDEDYIRKMMEKEFNKAYNELKWNHSNHTL